MKRFALPVALLLAIAACGDAPTEPDPFPDVAGLYSISGTFEGTALTFTGALVLLQPSRQDSTLSGTAVVHVTGADPITGLSSAFVSRDGSIRFLVGSPTSPGAEWRFQGQRMSDGGMEGAHVLTGPEWGLDGSWTAARN